MCDLYNTPMRGVAVTGKEQVSIVDDIPMPELTDYAALVRIRACGFCNGTDMQIINDTMPKGEAGIRYPTVLGHEACGEVVTLGKKVRNIAIGERYLHPVFPLPKNPVYFCNYGNMCEYACVYDHEAMLADGFAETELPFRGGFLRLPDGFDFVDGAAMISILECMSAVKNFGVTPGMDVLVYGAGPMGLGMMKCIEFAKAGSITLVEGIDERIRRAMEAVRIQSAVNFTRQSPMEAFSNKRFDMAFDMVGSSKVLYEASMLLKPGGKLCSMGVLRSDDSCLDVSRLQNHTTLHMLNMPYRRFDSLQDALSLMDEGLLDAKLFYSHVLPFTDVRSCIELVAQKRAFKVILTFD